MASFSFTKDPDAILDYGLDWSGWLVSDIITSSSWAISDGDSALVINSSSFSSTATALWLSGGTAGQSYTLTNHVVTAAGRADDRSFSVKVAQR